VDRDNTDYGTWNREKAIINYCAPGYHKSMLGVNRVSILLKAVRHQGDSLTVVRLDKSTCGEIEVPPIFQMDNKVFSSFFLLIFFLGVNVNVILVL
jgi:hypothetical protein